MSKKGILIFSILLSCVVKVCGTNSSPNIIYILADDLGYGDLGCYGQSILETPNIDKLASEGLLFTQHYSGCTVCAPSRSALLEGKHTGHTCVRGNLPYHLMQRNSNSMGWLMKAAGYRTAIIGKWGVGHPPPLDDPLQHGFDHHYGYVNMWHAHNFYPEYLYRNGEKDFLEGNVLDERLTFDRQPDGCGVAREKIVFAPYELEREVLDYLHQPASSPFFLFFALNQPHNNGEYARIFGEGGYEVPTFGKYTNMPWPAGEKGFAANIRIIDDIVGNVLMKLKEMDLENNTIVMFSSDNGACDGYGHDHRFFNSTGNLRGYKRDLYEGGIRVPLIVKWPGIVQPGSTSDHVSAMWDLLPTFCEITGVQIPAETDGISFVPTLSGKGKQAQHDYLYWEFHSMGGKQAVREGPWKAVKLNVTSSEPEVFELYDLEKDPFETQNMASQYPEIVKRMQAHMNQAHVEHDLLKLVPDETNDQQGH